MNFLKQGSIVTLCMTFSGLVFSQQLEQPGGLPSAYELNTELDLGDDLVKPIQKLVAPQSLPLTEPRSLPLTEPRKTRGTSLPDLGQPDQIALPQIEAGVPAQTQLELPLPIQQQTQHEVPVQIQPLPPQVDMQTYPQDKIESYGAFTTVTRLDTQALGRQTTARYVFDAVTGAKITVWYEDYKAISVAAGQGLLLIDADGKGMLLRKRADQGADTLLVNFPLGDANLVIFNAYTYDSLVVINTTDTRTGRKDSVFVDMSAGDGIDPESRVWVGFTNLADADFQNDFFVMRDEAPSPNGRGTHELAVFSRQGELALQRNSVHSFEVVCRNPGVLSVGDYLQVNYLDGNAEKIDLIKVLAGPLR